MPPKQIVDEAPLRFRQENPKRAGSKAYERYERYKTAKTVAEALRLGCGRADIAHDVKQGFCSMQEASTEPETAVPTPARSGGFNGQSVSVPPVKAPAADVEPRAQSPKPAAGPKADVAAACKKRGVDEIEGALDMGPPVSIRRSAEPAGDAVESAPAAVPSAPALASSRDLTSSTAGAAVPATAPVPAVGSATVATAAPAMAPTMAVASSSHPASVGTAVERSRFSDVDLSFAKLDGKPLKFVKRAMGEAKRLLCEQGLLEAKQGGYEFCLQDRENLSKWSVKLLDLNPSGHLKQDLVKHGLELCIDLEFCLPDGYPLEPPFARVVYPQLKGGYVFHHGGICFEPLTVKGWAPSMTLPALAIAIKGILDYGDVRVAGAGNRETRTVPQYTEQGARKDHMGIVAAHKDGASNTYSSLKNYSS